MLWKRLSGSCELHSEGLDKTIALILAGAFCNLHDAGVTLLDVSTQNQRVDDCASVVGVSVGSSSLDGFQRVTSMEVSRNVLASVSLDQESASRMRIGKVSDIKDEIV